MVLGAPDAHPARDDPFAVCRFCILKRSSGRPTDCVSKRVGCCDRSASVVSGKPPYHRRRSPRTISRGYRRERCLVNLLDACDQGNLPDRKPIGFAGIEIIEKAPNLSFRETTFSNGNTIREILHLPVLRAPSPGLAGLGSVILLPWCVVVGARLFITARASLRLKWPVPVRLSPVPKRLAVMAGSAFLSCLTGYFLVRNGVTAPPKWVLSSLALSTPGRLAATWWAHGASYGAGLIKGIVLCLGQYRRGRNL